MPIPSFPQKIALSRNLQDKGSVFTSTFFFCVAAFNAAHYRTCWRCSEPHYRAIVEELQITQIGRMVQVRVALLCVFNAHDKACACMEQARKLDDGLLVQLGYDPWFSLCYATPLYRSGREEEANALIDSGLAGPGGPCSASLYSRVGRPLSCSCK